MPWRTVSCAVISVPDITIGYFLEDRAHEVLLRAMVSRIAGEEGYHPEELIHDVRSAHGGQGIARLKAFLEQCAGGAEVPFDLLVAAIDGNCHGYNKRAQQLKNLVARAGYPAPDRVVLAVPDPHIERWYMLDENAFKRGVNAAHGPAVPPYKYRKDWYKKALSDAVRDAGVPSLLGGVEYGERIVAGMADWYHGGQRDAGFKHFVDDLRSGLRQVRAQNG